MQVTNVALSVTENSDRYVNDELFMAKCRISDFFALIGMLAFGCGLVSKLS